jgi:hypothetical protein
MEDRIEMAPAKHGWKLLGVKVLLGACAAAGGMGMMRVAGGREILVALFIGLVPGIAEKSLKKTLGGALLALIGYSFGARVGILIAKSASGVPLGHWAVTGAFIALTAAIRRYPDQSRSSRNTGAITGIVLGLVFGILGDIGGFFTVPAHHALPLFYYAREVSLLCAGVFINFAAGLASMLAMAAENRSRRRLVASAQGAQA